METITSTSRLERKSIELPPDWAACPSPEAVGPPLVFFSPVLALASASHVTRPNGEATIMSDE
eukprot:scaffold1056_cov564-Prasinococcus_capsulatus_cf.AAC.10